MGEVHPGVSDAIPPAQGDIHLITSIGILTFDWGTKTKQDDSKCYTEAQWLGNYHNEDWPGNLKSHPADMTYKKKQS